MGGANIRSAVAALRAELTDVERQLAGFEVLRARRERLVAAIDAAESVDRDVAASTISVPAKNDFAATVQRVVAQQLSVPAAPATPSEAALLVLRESAVPMRIKEIVAAIQLRGWFTERDYESLRGTIAGTLDARAKKGNGVAKPEPGVYVAWTDEDEAGGVDLSEITGPTERGALFAHLER